jgi:uncharacterized protein (TIGR03437 family)
VTAQVIVGVNNAGVRVINAKYAASLVGVYEITFQIPNDVTPGAYSLSMACISPTGSSYFFSQPSLINVGAATGAKPYLVVDKQSLTFSFSSSGTAAQTLAVSNAGGGSLGFTISSPGVPWLQVSPSSAVLNSNYYIPVTVTANAASLSSGTYRATLTIAGTNGDQIPVQVTMTVSKAQPTILLSVSGLTFVAVAQGGRALPQTFGILNTGQGTMDWSVSAMTLSGGSNWLQVSPSSGTVRQPYLDVSAVNVSVDASGLVPGDYYGRIQVSAAAANSPQLLTVALTVLPAGSNPGPELRPSGLIFTGLSGATPASQQVLLANPKPQTDNFTSSQTTRIATFTYSPSAASVDPARPTTLTVSPDFSKVSAGSVVPGAITLLFDDGTVRNISVLSVVAPDGTTSSPETARSSEPHASSCPSPKLEIQFRSLRPNFTAVIGQPTTVEVQVADDCGNLIGPGNIAGASVSTNFSNGDLVMKLTHIGNGVWTGTWRPIHPPPMGTSVTMTVTAFFAQGAALQSNQVDIGGNLTRGTAPTLTAGGVVHAASGAAGVAIAPGSLVTIYGTNLADTTGSASSLPLPQQISGTQVKIGDRVVPLLYTSAGQMNVQVPFDVPVDTQYQVAVQRGTELSVPEPLVVAATQPGIFALNQHGTGQGVIMRSDQVTVAQAGTPAAIGETVVIYCTGLGAVTPSVASGAPAPAAPVARTVNPVTVTIAGQTAQVQFSGLTPGFAGLYQVNAVVPTGVTASNTVPVVVSVGGQSSPPVTMAVK